MATYNPQAAISQPHLTSSGISSSLNTAMRATSIVILLMLSLALASALLARRPALAAVEQNWSRIMHTNPAVLR